jgi:hypothetical protein
VEPGSFSGDRVAPEASAMRSLRVESVESSVNIFTGAGEKYSVFVLELLLPFTYSEYIIVLTSTNTYEY